MPDFLPFPALRYTATDLDRLVAPPYDVLSDSEVTDLASRSAHNIVHLDVPRGGADRYVRAAKTLEDWFNEGVLVRDRDDTFTIYRLQFVDDTGTNRDIAGVIGALEVVDENASGVLPHERTTPKASTDRLDLTRATRANLSPVWGLSLAAGLTELLSVPGEVLATVESQGVTHSVERVSDPDRVVVIRDLVSRDDVLIADGHHRYSVARTYRDEVRAAGGDHSTPAELTLTFVSELVADQLSVAAIHRLYADVTVDELTAALERYFVLNPAEPPGAQTLAEMESAGYLMLVTAEQCWSLTPKPGVFDAVRSLDGEWLEVATEQTDANVTYQHGLSETVAAVQEGRAAAAVMIRPVSVAEIERTAREGLLMPPKSTFFTPKLKTGFVLRSLR